MIQPEIGQEQFVPLAETATDEEQHAFARRRLIVMPYSPWHWLDYAVVLDGLGAPENPFASDLSYENAVAFSNHNPFYLTQYMTHKFNQEIGLRNFEQNDTPPEWQRYRDTVDRPGKLYAHLCAPINSNNWSVNMIRIIPFAPK